jgi:serine/threonine protein kinase
MKEMSKVQIYVNESIDLILSERQILSQLHHPLISNLNYAFHDKEYLYLILDYLPGGDLRYYMKNNRYRFNESQIKFFVSNMILSLKYIHQHNIIHRDIKPENLIFDSKGYLHLTDFNISEKIKKNKPILNKSGTIGYLSPEVLLKKPQNFASDFYAVGVICYERDMGKIPFNGRNIKELAEKILYRKIDLNEDNMLGD